MEPPQLPLLKPKHSHKPHTSTKRRFKEQTRSLKSHKTKRKSPSGENDLPSSFRNCCCLCGRSQNSVLITIDSRTLPLHLRRQGNTQETKLQHFISDVAFCYEHWNNLTQVVSREIQKRCKACESSFTLSLAVKMVRCAGCSMFICEHIASSLCQCGKIVCVNCHQEYRCVCTLEFLGKLLAISNQS